MQKKKLFFIKKSVIATTLKDAVRRERKGKVEEVWEEKPERKELSSAIGFLTYNEEEE